MIKNIRIPIYGMMVIRVWEILVIRLVSLATEVLENNEKVFISYKELTCRVQVTRLVITISRLVNMNRQLLALCPREQYWTVCWVASDYNSEDSGLLQYDTVSLGDRFRTLKRKIVSPSSGNKRSSRPESLETTL